uniref:lysoplasmalogenase n=1 Tax=Parascaris univalens TaxID=6257 RepID=A0A915BXB4_PARUN
SKQMLVIYGGITALVYVETDEFRKDAPFLFAMPIIALALLTSTLSMHRKQKCFTTASFLAVALALYEFRVDRRELGLVCVLASLSHILYLFSFMCHVRRLWTGLAVVLAVYLVFLLHHCFADLFYSIPTLVIALSLYICITAVAVLAAGSIWQYGSKGIDTHQADSLRFIGLMVCLVYSSILILNQFGTRIDKSNYTLNILYYISQGLLFLANERAF